MIDVIFQVPDFDYKTEPISMPFVPSLRDQIFLGDFISEEDQESLFLSDNSIDIDGLTVAGVAWMRNSNETEIYVMITLISE